MGTVLIHFFVRTGKCFILELSIIFPKKPYLVFDITVMPTPTFLS